MELDSWDRPCKTYSCSYEHDEGNWSFTITAYDWRDAEARVAKMGSVKLEGALVEQIGWSGRSQHPLREALSWVRIWLASLRVSTGETVRRWLRSE